MNSQEKEKMKTLSILYVEDEESIRANITETLSLIFKNVTSVASADEAFKEYEKNHFDLILSDIELGGKSGIDFVKKVRETNWDIPVIFLTAHLETSILIESTKLKLTEYLTKPIKFDELFQALVNATNDIIQATNSFLELPDGIKYDKNNKLLIKNGDEVHLTLSESKLLDLLIEAKGEVVLKESIKDTVWNDSFDVSESAFKSLLNKLRTKVGKKTIKNLSGVGYCLVLK